MARDQETIAVGGGWTQLTNSDVTNISFQVVKGSVYLRGTTDETTPTEAYGFRYSAGEGEANIALTDLFNAVGIDRVWAKRAGSGEALVHVDTA